MDGLRITNIILSIIVMIFLILLTIKLILRMKETKLMNLKWLIGIFVSNALVGVFKMAQIDVLFYASELLSLIFLTIFTKETFYRERKNPFKLIIIILLGLSISIIILRLVRDINPIGFYLMDTYLLSIAILLPSTWFIISASSAYELLRDEKISELIKKRYKLVGISAIFLILQGFFIPINAINSQHTLVPIDTQLFTIINVIILLLFAITSYYAWVLLGKKIEQENERFVEKELSEEDIRNLIKEAK